MLHSPVPLAVLASALAFGAASAVLALMGLGVPFLLAALGAAACAGLVVHAATRPPAAETGKLVQEAERAAALRHDLRGALSPALMVADRLSSSEDPSTRRAGLTVVRSIERATSLLAVSKAEDEAPGAAPAGPAPPGP